MKENNNSPSSQINIKDYFKRINYEGTQTPSITTLNGIIAAHVKTIPFENLDIIFGQNIVLDASSLQKKLIYNKRGGYCFEQNRLLILILEALDFNVTPIGGRIRNGCKRNFIPPRTHLLAHVKINDQHWFADVGVGSLSPTSAIQFILNKEQKTTHESRRIIREGSSYFHQACLRGKWQDVCEFTLEKMHFIDQNIANWYTCTHPQSFFKDKIRVALPLSNGTRIAIKDNIFITRNSKGNATKYIIKSKEELFQILAEKFNLRFNPETMGSIPINVLSTFS